MYSQQNAIVNKKDVMNTTEFNENWEDQKKVLKQKIATITDNDLIYFEEKKEELLGKLQIKLGKTKEEVQEVLKSL